MKKHFVAFLICISVLISFLPVYAYEPYINEDIIKIHSVNFKDVSTDKPVTCVSPGQTIHASVSFKAAGEGSMGQNVSLILSAYSGNEVVAYSEETSYAELNIKELEADLKIPDECPNLSFKAFVWDSLDNALPLAEYALLGSNNVEIEDILINNQSLEGFSTDVKTYNYEVGAAYCNFPEITVKTADSAAKVNILINGKLYEDNSYAYITVSSADNTVTDNYEIIYTWEKPQVENVYLNLPGEMPLGLSTSIVDNPLWEDGKEPQSNPAFIPALISGGTTGNIYNTSQYFDERWLANNLPQSNTRIFTDRNWYYIDVSDELMGGIAIVTPYSSISGNNNTSINNLITFEINRTANVYVQDGNRFRQPHLISDYGFENMNVPLAYRMMSYDDYYQYQHLYFYRKEYKVEPGEKVTVTLPYSGETNMYSVIVKFADDISLDNSSLVRNNFTKEYFPIVRKTFTPNYKNYSLETPAVWSNIKFYPRYTYDNPDGSSSKVPVLYIEKEYLGGNLLRFPTYINSSGAYSYAEFDVVSSCRIKFIWNHSATKNTINLWAESNGWTASDTTTMQLLTMGTPYNCLIGGSCYEKEFNIIPGDVEHISIPLPESDRQLYIYSTPIDLD